MYAVCVKSSIRIFIKIRICEKKCTTSIHLLKTIQTAHIVCNKVHILKLTEFWQSVLILLCIFFQPDWAFVLGEQALDVLVPSFSHSSSSILVLGERNLFCFRDNGQIRFMKKLEFNPSCFLPYASGKPRF